MAEKKTAKTTQIGSLPFDDIARALDYSLQYDIPFLPELTKLGDGMFWYIQKPGRLSCLKEFQKQKFDAVKIQSIGPISLVNDPSNELTLDNAVEKIYAHIDKVIQGLDAKEIILFLDEPGLGYSGLDFNELWEPIFSSFKTVRGVHCCGLMQWDLLLKSPLIDIVSFDASEYDITRHYKKRNKQIAWGIRRASEIRDFKANDLITSPCGLSHYKYTEEEAYKVFKELKMASEAYEK